MDLDRDSDRSSSPLSSLASRSPSPPPDYSFHHYLSPMSSQQSSNRGSPTPRITNPTTTDAEGPPPPKRRRVAGPKIRETLRLDLSVTPTPDGQDKPIEALMKLLHGKKKVVVIAGAGISVSAGIPDFRSKEGLFQTLRSDYKLKSSGKDLFDASVYSQDSSTSSFHHMVREMSAKTREAQPTPFHHLLARLAHEGRLLRLYTQNVDGIETSMEPLQTRVPLQKPWPKTVQLHGSLEKMVCSKCKTLSEFDGSLFDGPEAPLCKQCETDDFTRTNYAGKRSHGIGRLRPRMVLYNEHNPDEEAIGEVSSADLRTRPDALIVVGTTLKVYGIRKLAKELAGVVRGRRDGLTVWINHGREPSGYGLENCWDIIVKGPCDEVARLAAMPKWNEDPTSDETRAPSDKSSPFMGVFLGKSKGASSIPTPIASPKTEVAIDSNLASLDEKSVSSLQLNGDNDGADGKTMKPESTSIVDMLKSQKPSTKVNVVKKGAPKKNTQPKRAKRAASGKSKKEKATVGNNKTLTNTFSVSKKSKQPANVKPVKKESAEVEHAVIPAPGNDSKEVATSVLQNDDNAPRPRSHIDQNDNNAAKLRSHIPVTHTPSKFTSSLQLPDPFAIESSQSRLESQENIGQAAAIIKPEQHSPHPDSPSQSLHTSLSSIPLKRSGPKISKSDDGSGTDGSSNRDRIELIDGSRVPAEGSFMSISYSDARMHHIPTGVDADVYPLEAPPNPDEVSLDAPTSWVIQNSSFSGGIYPGLQPVATAYLSWGAIMSKPRIPFI
ncbi:DHS-like NAD/FAD-binding domain-containing protein [Eremomyces bilateralis CBS 781.70]|uniref:DHS-like NAD/FAD-binding domain-containing protein n=1 Tax=Eremomyces bilateralis CBS 781.70 TaxID=1392243 RepID=A0A6G1GHG9_9PEZI|nr:DHS-like NAD/FAD-binding domain-containing protein [Eremomyces bilateralis CBS 781.70]KAF1817518.1 DHS-like NAD/FAD-binding domain-containing protein [Eremomyces bilateralis CBS 781.70]